MDLFGFCCQEIVLGWGLSLPPKSSRGKVQWHYHESNHSYKSEL